MDGIEMTAGGGGVARLRVPSRAIGAATASPSAAAEEEAVPALGDVVSLLAASAPPIDTGKVEALRSLIAQGSYPIDPEAVAASMVAATFPEGGDGADA